MDSQDTVIISRDGQLKEMITQKRSTITTDDQPKDGRLRYDQSRFGRLRYDQSRFRRSRYELSKETTSQEMTNHSK